MFDPFLLNISALVALVPMTLTAWREPPARGRMFWLMLIVAIVGTGALLILTSADGWRSDLSTSIWITIFTSLVLYALICTRNSEAVQLNAIVSLYMLILGIGALVWSQWGVLPSALPATDLSGWVISHIFVSVATYALVTLAAVASLAAVLQERALKAKQQNRLAHGLPSLADCDRLVVRMLLLGEIILALGLLSGMALQFMNSDELFALNHKTILSVTAFIVIGGLLIAHYSSGLRGRKAARIVLLGYLLLTLGYPGVKFVTDVLLAS